MKLSSRPSAGGTLGDVCKGKRAKKDRFKLTVSAACTAGRHGSCFNQRCPCGCHVAGMR